MNRKGLHTLPYSFRRNCKNTIYLHHDKYLYLPPWNNDTMRCLEMLFAGENTMFVFSRLHPKHKAQWCPSFLARVYSQKRWISDVIQPVISPSVCTLPPSQGHYTVIAPAWGPACDAIVVSPHRVACKAPMKSEMKQVGSPAISQAVAYCTSRPAAG